MSRYSPLFDRLAADKHGAFVPFLMLGDPDLASSFELICEMVEAGADALELGIPFSDPVADGPTIQEAAIRALAAGTTPAKALGLVARVRERYPELPMGLLVYANLVHAAGLDAFYGRCAEAGVDSVLVADVPLREAAPFIEAARANAVAPVLIAPPNASDDTLRQVAKQSQGYVYLVSRAGVTGTESRAGSSLSPLVQKLKDYGAPPVLLGFGIASPADVQAALAQGVDGAISGSAAVKASTRGPKALGRFVAGMKAASRGEFVDSFPGQ
ncbi:tryptophan synthase subunit alpha [Gallaecimonas sp. GXIMD4217]|uniref:tryptophan synthase subunit alpha n=1 Tax=Gallaecimonas sp. GXIMD4217 TaxID=3131927 RepID=UPI00311ABE5B